MRVARIAVLVILSLALPSEGGAQYRPRSILADAIEANAARSAEFAALGGAAPRCDGSLAGALLGGAVFGGIVGTVFGFFFGLSMPFGGPEGMREIMNSAIIGGAVVFAVVGAVHWNRNCRAPVSALP
jgi:hypothetical protein